MSRNTNLKIPALYHDGQRGSSKSKKKENKKKRKEVSRLQLTRTVATYCTCPRVPFFSFETDKGIIGDLKFKT